MQTLLLPFTPRYVALTLAWLLTFAFAAAIGGSMLSGWDAPLGVGVLRLPVSRRARRPRSRADQAFGAAQLSDLRASALPARVHPAGDAAVLLRERHRRPAVLAQPARGRLPARQGQLDKRPFGTQLDTDAHRLRMAQPFDGAGATSSREPFRITIGGPDCRQPYSASVFNISAMSFGALSANAIRALNRGAKLGGFAHDTGEGGSAPITARTAATSSGRSAPAISAAARADGGFDADQFAAAAADPQVKMIEIKLSQGAKPGHGGVLPAAEGDAGDRRASAACELGEDCISPARHSAFSTPLEMMRLHRAAARALGRQAGRLQALHRPSLGVLRHLQGDAGDRHLSRLHRRRRRRGRHRRGAARVHRPRRHAAARGPGVRAQRAGRASARRSASASAARARSSAPSTWRRDGARRRLVQRGARLHVRARLHPVAELPHRPLPDRRGDAGPGAAARAGGRGQDRAGAQLPPLDAAFAGGDDGGGGARASRTISAPNISRRRVSEREVLSFAELYPPLPRGALLGAIEDPHWRRMWEMASADSFSVAG